MAEVWKQVASKLQQFNNLSVEQFSAETIIALTKLINRNMEFQCSIQDGQLWLTSGDDTLLIETITLK